MSVSTKDIRNIVFLSHSGAGKTTLVENLLFKGGTISKLGNVKSGTTVSDYCDDEKESAHSINLSVSSYETGGIKVNLLDAPGYLDYVGEVSSGVNAADSAMLVIDATGGVQVGTNKFWKLAKARSLPGMIVINKMDKDNADFEKVLENVKNRFGKHCIALCYPNGKGATFSGMANLLTKDGLDKLEGTDKERADKLASDLTEGVAESDDALLEKYLEEGELSTEELKKAFRAGVVSGKIVPVIPASFEKGIGIEQIMTMIRDYMASPEDRPGVEVPPAGEDAEPVVIKPDANASFSAQIFKTISDPYAGQISIFKVISGKAVSSQIVKNTTTDNSEKLGQLFFLKGKDQIQAEFVVAGDIAAAAKFKNTHTGDSLSDDKKPLRFAKMNFPEPAISFSINPKVVRMKTKYRVFWENWLKRIVRSK